MTDHPSTREAPARCPNVSRDGFQCGRDGGHAGHHSALLDETAAWRIASALPGVREPAEPRPLLSEATIEQMRERLRGVENLVAEWRAEPFPDAFSFRSVCCEGERCLRCGAPADGKVEEVIFDDDPSQARHPFTAYLCRAHLRETLIAGAALSTAHATAERTKAELDQWIEADRAKFLALCKQNQRVEELRATGERLEGIIQAQNEEDAQLRHQRDALQEWYDEAHARAGRLEGENKELRALVLARAVEFRFTESRTHGKAYTYTLGGGWFDSAEAALDAYLSSLPAPLPAPEAT